MNRISAVLSLCICSMCHAGSVYTIPVHDLVQTIPQWTDAPEFNLNRSLSGRDFITDTPPVKLSKSAEKELQELLSDLFPDCTIRIRNGVAYIREK